MITPHHCGAIKVIAEVPAIALSHSKIIEKLNFREKYCFFGVQLVHSDSSWKIDVSSPSWMHR